MIKAEVVRIGADFLGKLVLNAVTVLLKKLGVALVNSRIAGQRNVLIDEDLLHGADIHVMGAGSLRHRDCGGNDRHDPRGSDSAHVDCA